jgi:3-oxoacyl-(acyl-carrier-protein) synthase
VSAITDLKSLTITTTKQSSAQLIQAMFSYGFIARPIEVQGRFHNLDLQPLLQRIKRLCSSSSDWMLPDAESLLVPVRSNDTAKVIKEGSVFDTVLDCIICKPADWLSVISSATDSARLSNDPSSITFGFVEVVPSSILQQADLKVTRIWKASAVLNKEINNMPVTIASTPSQASSGTLNFDTDNSVAIIGMGCKFPGANSPEEFWKLIRDGRSMTEQVPKSRFSTENLRRSSSGTLFWGNFIDNVDAFDHKFFKKSAREAVQMDPQQRLLLEVAYQTLQSAGYFREFPSQQNEDVGCYVGVNASDYNDNVASWDPSAFSSLGTLRAFISGKVSHYFKWSGPSITYDTACSSSLVAIYSACQAITAGDCSMALAGGVNIFTNPIFFQNLMAASFLSTTGPTKAFDSSADGYCRGEGIGLVALKKLSKAVFDGDNILGVISAIAVNQGTENPITVPHSAAQVSLYRKVVSLARVDPLSSITYVEAHGTGTQVGDPIEAESIRQVFGSRTRPNTLCK